MKKVRVSLRVKFSIIIILFSSVILLYNFIVTGYSILNKNQAFLAKVLLQDAVKSLEYFSSTVNDGLVLDDDILLINTFDKIKKMDNIDYAILFDKDKNIRLHSETFAKQELDKNNEIFNNLENATNITIYPAFNAKDIKNSYVILKVFTDNKNQFNGMLLVKYSTATLSQLIGQIRDSFIFNMRVILITGIIFAVLIGILMATITLLPIKTMVKGMEIVGKGNLDYVLPVKRNDELGFLSNSFNEMTQKIKEGQKFQIEQKKNEEQMLIAKGIQESIFPEKPLIESNYEIASFTVAAKIIGGDYNYFKKIDSRYSYFTVADISGKGVPAALITFMLSTVLHAIIGKEKNYDAGFLLTETNKIAFPELVKMERYATAMLCFFDDQDKTLNFASAGHGDLYVFRGNTNNFMKSTNTFLPLGVLEETEYKSGKIKLYPNDIVVIITDGITDAKNEEKKDYGINRFLNNKSFYENLPLEELLHRLKEDVFNFISKAEQFDDMTLLLFKLKA
jgi:serine phosphatase RsbU (regulator of sigma subunit)